MISFQVRYKGAPALSSARVEEGHHHQLRRAGPEGFAIKRGLVFALAVATGAAVCACTILAIFAWSGAGL
jgi:hypothetical protein